MVVQVINEVGDWWQNGM